jgi:hypothetical protein
MKYEKLTGVNALIEGDSTTIGVDAEDTRGDDIDLADGDVKAVIADDRGDAARVTKTTAGGGITWTDRSAGNFDIHLESNDTDGLIGTYWLEVSVTKSGGDEYTVLGTWIEFIRSTA